MKTLISILLILFSFSETWAAPEQLDGQGCSDALRSTTTSFDEAAQWWEELENFPSDGFDRPGSLTKMRRNAIQFFSALKREKPSDIRLLENFSAMTNLMMFHLLEYRLSGSTQAEHNFSFIWKRMLHAVKTQEIPAKQILKTIDMEWEDRMSVNSALSRDMERFTEFVFDVSTVLDELKEDRQIGASITLNKIDAGFFARDFQQEMLSLRGNLSARHLVHSKFLTDISKQSDDSYANKVLDSITSRFDIDLIANNLDTIIRSFNIDKHGYLFLALAQWSLFDELVRTAGGNSEQAKALVSISILQKIDFSDFLKVFPSPYQYSKELYLSSLKKDGDYERAIIENVFSKPGLKKELFQAAPPKLNSAQMSAWINVANPEEVEELLTELGKESFKVQQVASRLLQDNLQFNLKALKKDPSLVEFYADDILESLTRLSVDMNGSLFSEKLKALKSSRNEVVARFFSRRPRDLTLGRKTGDCTSFRSVNFERSLRWFANTSGQIMTFSAGGTFLAKAYLVLFDKHILVDAFEINPTTDRGQPQHQILVEHIAGIMNQISAVGARIGLPIVVVPIANSSFAKWYLQGLPSVSKLEIFDDEYKPDMASVVSLLAGPDSKLYKSSKDWADPFYLESKWTFLQSVTHSPLRDSVDLTPEWEAYFDLRSSNNENGLGFTERTLTDIFTKALGIPAQGFDEFRFADLPSRDSKLDQLDQLVQREYKHDAEFRSKLEQLNVAEPSKHKDNSHYLSKKFEELNTTDNIDTALSLADEIAEDLGEEIFLDLYSDVRIGGTKVKFLKPGLADKMFSHRLIYLYFYRRFDTAVPPNGQGTANGWATEYSFKNLSQLPDAAQISANLDAIDADDEDEE